MGQVDKDTVFLHNHLTINFKYNKLEDPETKQPLYRIVGFTVIPQSIDSSEYSFDDNDGCSIANEDHHQEISDNTKSDLIFSYSVRWEVSDIRWASRWDTYLEMGDVQIHW